MINQNVTIWYKIYKYEALLLYTFAIERSVTLRYNILTRSSNTDIKKSNISNQEVRT